MRSCAKKCLMTGEQCPEKKCKYWLDHKESLNCTLVTIEEKGKHTLQEVGDRMGISLVSVFQIEKRALKKLKKRLDEFDLFLDK